MRALNGNTTTPGTRTHVWVCHDTPHQPECCPHPYVLLLPLPQPILTPLWRSGVAGIVALMAVLLLKAQVKLKTGGDINPEDAYTAKAV